MNEMNRVGQLQFILKITDAPIGVVYLAPGNIQHVNAEKVLKDNSVQMGC